MIDIKRKIEREIEKREKGKILPLTFDVIGSPIIGASNPVHFWK
jgi:hypothetical protein